MRLSLMGWCILGLVAVFMAVWATTALIGSELRESRRRTRLVVLSERGDTVANIVGHRCSTGAMTAGILFTDGRAASFALASGVAYCVKAR